MPSPHHRVRLQMLWTCQVFAMSGFCEWLLQLHVFKGLVWLLLWNVSFCLFQTLLLSLIAEANYSKWVHWRQVCNMLSWDFQGPTKGQILQWNAMKRRSPLIIVCFTNCRLNVLIHSFANRTVNAKPSYGRGCRQALAHCQVKTRLVHAWLFLHRAVRHNYSNA